MRNIPALVIFSSALFLGKASAQFEEPSLTLKRIQMNGSGCPIGTTNVSVDDEGDLIIDVEEMLAEAGPGISLSEGRKNCVMTIVADAPKGWQYALGAFEIRGFMSLEEGVKASVNASIFFEGQGTTGRFQSTKQGPFVSDFYYRDILDISHLVWSPCTVQRALNINMSILTAQTQSKTLPNARGLIIRDAIHAKAKDLMKFVWRRC